MSTGLHSTAPTHKEGLCARPSGGPGTQPPAAPGNTPATRSRAHLKPSRACQGSRSGPLLPHMTAQPSTRWKFNRPCPVLKDPSGLAEVCPSPGHSPLDKITAGSRVLPATYKSHDTGPSAHICHASSPHQTGAHGPYPHNTGHLVNTQTPSPTCTGTHGSQHTCMAT